MKYWSVLRTWFDEHGRGSLWRKCGNCIRRTFFLKNSPSAVREEDYAGALKSTSSGSGNQTRIRSRTTAMIAESLDDHEAQFRALQLAARRDKQPKSSPTLSLPRQPAICQTPRSPWKPCRRGCVACQGAPSFAVLWPKTTSTLSSQPKRWLLYCTRT